MFVNFEDVEVVFGLNKLLDGAVVGGDGHHAGQILKAPLAVHPHLNILSRLVHLEGSFKMGFIAREQNELDFVVSWWVPCPNRRVRGRS